MDINLGGNTLTNGYFAGIVTGSVDYFLVYASPALNNTHFPHYTTTQVPFDSVLGDTLSGFDTSTSAYTVQRAGRLVLGGITSFHPQGMTTDGSSAVNIVIMRGSAVIDAVIFPWSHGYNVNSDDYASRWFGSGGCGIYDVQVGDEITMQAFCTSGNHSIPQLLDTSDIESDGYPSVRFYGYYV